ncbi:MAG TPA: hypothetical protein VGW12_18370 [Pyrinomonadaceae bacterium]|nr:hypothetical protein [Pyrinomonadaceae bacterium]
MNTFTFINNVKLCEIIHSAAKHVIYAAPSVSLSVAESLYEFTERHNNATLRVIVDVDAEAFRLGFGEHAGLKLLADKSIDLRRAQGLRIAVLVADEDAWVYSPTPEIIFEQPTEAYSNAIHVSVDFAEQILLSVAPDVRLKSAEEVLSQNIVVEDLAPEIGAEVFTSENLAEINRELKENPPQKFDATRKVRVYQGYFQFVELSLTGCRLASHTINIPSSLLNIAENSDLRNRVRSTCRLVDNTSEFSRKIKAVEDKVKKLRDDYIRSLGKRYGSVILRKQRMEFDKQVGVIQEELKKLSESVKEELRNEVRGSRSKLIEMLLPGFMEHPPQKLKSTLFGDLDKSVAEKFIGDELDRHMPDVEKLVGEMQLNCDYKDVTFEMLNDEAFIKAIEEKYPYNDFSKLYSEQETIGER